MSPSSPRSSDDSREEVAMSGVRTRRKPSTTAAAGARSFAVAGTRTRTTATFFALLGLMAISSSSTAAAAAAAANLGPVTLPSVPNLMARSGAAVRSASRGVRSASRRIGSNLQLPSLGGDPMPRTTLASTAKRRKKRRSNNSGFYYGIKEDVMLRPPSEREDDDGAEVSSPSVSGKDGPPASSPSPGGSGQRLMASSPRSRPYDSRAALSDIMGETLLELREMREEIAGLREEMRIMKRRMRTAVVDEYDEDYDEEDGGSGEIPGSDRRRLLAQGEGEEEYPHPHHEQHGGIGSMLAKRRKAREFDRIGLAVEKWAEKCLFDEGGEEDGWKEVACNKMVRKKFNRDGTTTCYLKWMKDSRSGDPGVTGVSRGGGGGELADDDDGKEYPCVKVYATIDAPLETVCDYLSDESRLKEYNDLVVANRDLEEITPHSKITWGQTPQILFVKPRDFVTFCHHRWRRDGTQVIVNQAVEHDDAPGCHTENDGDGKDGRICRAHALRGANFIQRDPNDPQKTRMAILAHADPGGGIPQWATKTAVNAVAPIEPFKLFHNIERGIRRAMEEGTAAREVSTRNVAEMAAAKVPGRSSRPGGLSQLGYACFWPNGGGLKEGFLGHEERHPHDDDMYPHEGPPPPPASTRSQQHHSGEHGHRLHSSSSSSSSHYDSRGAEGEGYYDPVDQR